MVLLGQIVATALLAVTIVHLTADAKGSGSACDADPTENHRNPDV